MEECIDLRGCGSAVRERFFDQMIVPIKRGQHQKNFDVLEDECDSKFIERQKWRANRNLRKQQAKEIGSRTGLSFGSEVLPMGFNWQSIPHGAVVLVRGANGECTKERC